MCIRVGVTRKGSGKRCKWQLPLDSSVLLEHSTILVYSVRQTKQSLSNYRSNPALAMFYNTRKYRYYKIVVSERSLSLSWALSFHFMIEHFRIFTSGEIYDFVFRTLWSSCGGSCLFNEHTIFFFFPVLHLNDPSCTSFRGADADTDTEIATELGVTWRPSAAAASYYVTRDALKTCQPIDHCHILERSWRSNQYLM